jgi:uncharacterized membrane protein YdjX (TVP38/TMEM64 family)
MKKLLRNRKFVISVLALAVFYIVLFIVFRKFEITTDKINGFVAPLGAYGFLMLFLLQLIGSLTPIPDAPLISFAVILYGPVNGAIAVFLGMYLAANIHFLIAKKLGKDYIIKKFPAIETFLQKYSSNTGYRTLTLMRIFNLLSFDVVSYYAGISGVSFKRFTGSTVTALGFHVVLNAIFATTLVGHNIFEVMLANVISLFH